MSYFLTTLASSTGTASLGFCPEFITIDDINNIDSIVVNSSRHNNLMTLTTQNQIQSCANIDSLNMGANSYKLRLAKGQRFNEDITVTITTNIGGAVNVGSFSLQAEQGTPTNVLKTFVNPIQANQPVTIEDAFYVIFDGLATDITVSISDKFGNTSNTGRDGLNAAASAFHPLSTTQGIMLANPYRPISKVVLTNGTTAASYVLIKNQ